MSVFNDNDSFGTIIGTDRGRKRRGRTLVIYSIVITLACIVLFALCLTFAIRARRAERSEEKAASELYSLSENMASMQDENASLVEMNQELDKSNQVLSETGTGALFKAKLREMTESGYSFLQILKYFFPEQLVIADAGQYHFFDINKNLRMHGLKDEFFYLNSGGEIEYRENGQNIGIKGIDVSQYNGVIDWSRVAASGVEFAYVRCGIRGYGSGKLVEDDGFSYNLEAANAAGIRVGVYFFTQAVTEEEAREEAEFVLERIEGKNTPCPVALDVENVSNADGTPRTAYITKEQYTKNVIAFCERIKEAGYTPIIDGNIKT